jgi:hypothetical protein
MSSLSPYSGNLGVNTYFKNDIGKIVKIKDIVNSLLVFDLDGVEKRMNPADFMRFLNKFNYRQCDSSAMFPEKYAIQESIESDKSIDAIINES